MSNHTVRGQLFLSSSLLFCFVEPEYKPFALVTIGLGITGILFDLYFYSWI